MQFDGSALGRQRTVQPNCIKGSSPPLAQDLQKRRYRRVRKTSIRRHPMVTRLLGAQIVCAILIFGPPDYVWSGEPLTRGMRST
jgi:hypothetical protein